MDERRDVPELPPSLRLRLERVVDLAQGALRRTLDAWPPERPAPVHTRNGRWYRPQDLWTDWTPGFLAGQLWILHRLTGDAFWRAKAEEYTQALAPRRFDRDVHDLGFIFLPSYGRWFHVLEPNDPRRELVREVLITAATVQSFRWNGNGPHGFIYSFNGPQSLFVDILMNVRLLFWAGAHGAAPQVVERAREHVRTSIRFLVRRDGPGLGEEDGSVAHEAIFNTEPGRGEFRCLSTQQGWSPFTCWSRGLGWAIYGLAECAGWTGETEFLEAAERCARYYERHTPPGAVPYWDYGAPGIPEEPVDSSAGAAIACGLLALSRVVEDSARARALEERAAALASTLTSDEYLGVLDGGRDGLLLHGVYHRPRGWGVGESVLWGDYFFLELVERLLAGPPPGAPPTSLGRPRGGSKRAQA